MLNGLLAFSDMPPGMMIPLIVGGVLGALMLLIGFIKKFSRMTWFSYQVLALFGISLLFPMIANTGSALTNFIIMAVALFVGASVVLSAGYFLRRAMIMKKLPAHWSIHLLDRLLGSVTVVVNLVLYLGIIGGSVLTFVYYIMPDMSALSVVFQNELWVNYGVKYALDLALLALTMRFVRFGYEAGLVRTLQMIVMLVLTFGCVLGGLLFVMRVKFMSSFVGLIASWFPSLGSGAGLLGFVLAWFITSVLFFAVLMTLNFFFNKLVVIMYSNKIFEVINGGIFALVCFGLLVAIACGFNYGMEVLSQNPFVSLGDAFAGNEALAGLGETLASVGATVATYAGKIAEAVKGTASGGILYINNPLLLLSA